MQIMKLSHIIIFLLLPLLSIAQKEEFQIFGTLQGQYKSDSKIYFCFENNLKQKDSSEIKDGKFYFKGTAAMPILGRLILGRDSFIEDFYVDGNNISIDCSTRWNINRGGNAGLDTMNVLQITHVKGSKLEEVKFKFETWASALTKSTKTEEQKRREYFDKLSKIVQENPKSKVSPYLVSMANHLYYNQVMELASLYDSSFNNSYEGKNVQRLLKRLDVSKNYAIGVDFKDFIMKNSSNKAVDTRQLRQKYTVIIFWASWCGPCRAEHPEINALYEKYRQKGLALIGVSVDTDKAKWITAIKKDKLHWPQLSDLKGNDSEITNYYGLGTGIGIPFNLLVDKEGKIIEKDLEVKQLQEKLETLL
jgi:peroxiredoxin